jgi:hypothetical protein
MSWILLAEYQFDFWQSMILKIILVLRSDEDHLLKNDLRSDQDHIFPKEKPEYLYMIVYHFFGHDIDMSSKKQD